MMYPMANSQDTKIKDQRKKKRRRYGSFAWKHPKTGLLYARIRVKQPNGKLKTIYERAENVTHAEQIGNKILAEHSVRGQAFIDARGMTFRQLANWYKDEYVIPPVYVDGKKVDGMRSWEDARGKIDNICNHIGNLLVEELSEEDLQKYKRMRLTTVKIATVNRDMELIRSMINRAQKKKWRTAPLDFSELLNKSFEDRRTVTVTNDDEAKLLRKAMESMSSAPRLFALIVTLRDSGARPSELYPVSRYDKKKIESSDDEQLRRDRETVFYEPLRWRDVFVFDKSGNVKEVKDTTVFISYKGKQRVERIGIVSERMKEAFQSLWNHLKESKRTTEPHRAEPENLIFPHKSYKKSFNKIRDEANLPDLRLRDLRRDWVTRLSRLGYSDKLAQRGAGHTNMQASFEYTEFDEAAALQAKMLIDKDNRR